MSRQVVVLIHGMGNHAAPRPDSNQRGSFGRECIDALDGALSMYPSLRARSIEDSIDLVEIHYNHLFDTFRAEMARNGQQFSELLRGAGAGTPLGNVPGIVEAVANFEAALGDSDTEYTHWLDVILYKLYFGEVVRLHVARRLGDIIARNNTRDIHILAHSLGTAVIHDTLHKIYRRDYADHDDIVDLSPVTHKLASLWQIANVSRLANSVLRVADPYKSLVKPGAEGVTATMMNIHHELDPFTWLRRFSRPDNGKWIPESVYRRAYLDIETSAITRVNTHSIAQYLEDPEVHLYLFRRLGIPVPPKRQRERAQEAYRDRIIDTARQELKQRLESITRGNAATLKDFFAAAKALRDAIETTENA